MLNPLNIIANLVLLTICCGITQSCKKASTASVIDSQPEFEEQSKLANRLVKTVILDSICQLWHHVEYK